jgi:hypothetical protein
MADVRQGLRQRGPVRKACDEAGVGVEVRPGELGRRRRARGGSDWRVQAMGGRAGLGR